MKTIKEGMNTMSIGILINMSPNAISNILINLNMRNIDFGLIMINKI